LFVAKAVYDLVVIIAIPSAPSVLALIARIHFEMDDCHELFAIKTIFGGKRFVSSRKGAVRMDGDTNVSQEKNRVRTTPAPSTAE
jgi:hypothetical protein